MQEELELGIGRVTTGMCILLQSSETWRVLLIDERRLQSRNRTDSKRSYRPKQAQTLSEARWALNARRIDEATGTFAQERLLEQWGPEQISGHAAISPETVYQRIYADKRAGGKKQPLVQLNGSNLCSQSRCLVTRAGRDSNSLPLGSQDGIQTIYLY
ncbi:hypothetical protein OYT1_ch1657 [Ferriphaselus amnicola]|uniref:Uncharacterized protein n=1 Tax=Ferriphaselus amnicola TaxID=1188319 RepID=A0A2Z6GD08_9PROT|nr:hypothetical protein OYT1_ch1657 [Ferriphaselus amnicola]